MKKYIQIWWKSKDKNGVVTRGEVWQAAECDKRGNPAEAVGFVDDYGNPTQLPEPHEAIAVGQWEDRPPKMPAPPEPPAPEPITDVPPPPAQG